MTTRLLDSGWMTNFLGVRFSGIETWLNTAPNFSRAKILQVKTSVMGVKQKEMHRWLQNLDIIRSCRVWWSTALDHFKMLGLNSILLEKLSRRHIVTSQNLSKFQLNWCSKFPPQKGDFSPEGVCGDGHDALGTLFGSESGCVLQRLVRQRSQVEAILIRVTQPWSARHRKNLKRER